MNSTVLVSILTKPSPRFTIPLPCFFPVCLAGTPQTPTGSHKRGQANGTVSNRDLLWDGSLLSEVGSALASRVLDRTSRACVSAQAGATGIAALFRPKDARFTKSTRRNNRSARVLAASKLLTIPPAKGHNSTRMAALVNALEQVILGACMDIDAN